MDEAGSFGQVMRAMLDALKSLRPWQIGVLVAVFAAAVGAAYGVYALVGSSGQEGLSEGQQLIPVQYGDLVNQVSINGSLIFPERETLTFGAQGTVEEVLVEEGQLVVEGQPLARLDESAVSNLEKAVAQARVDLQDAKGALDELLLPSPLDAAQAEARVADARLALNDVQESLDGLLEPTAEEMAQAEAAVVGAKITIEDERDALDWLLEPTAEEMALAEAAVVGAKITIEDVRDALDGLLEPTDRDMVQAEAKVTEARLAVENASTTLEALISGPGGDDVAKARSQIDLADTSLANARRDLKLTQKEWDSKQLAAVDSIEASFGDYQGVLLKWLGAEIDEEETDQDPTILLESWGTDLVSLFESRPRFYDSGRAWLVEGSRDDPATRWHETVVYAWVNFYPGPFTVTCDGTEAVGQAPCIAREIDDAWDALRVANDELDTVETQGAKALANAESAVTRAEEGLAATEEALDDLKAGPDFLEVERTLNEVALAQVDLDQAETDLAALINGPDPLEVEAKRNQLAVAQANLDQAEADLATLTNGPDPLEVEAKRNQLAVAQVNLDQAEMDFVALTNGPDPLEVEAKRRQVAVAVASLDQAEEDLADGKGGADPLELALLEVEVMSAQAALDASIQRLEDATLRAPWDGIVSVVNIEAGQSVNANTPAIEIVNPTEMEVDGIVDEIDVLFVREGAQAAVTMDALPGGVLDGVVSAIASAAQNQQGVVSYPIRVQVQVPEGVQLREGLSATANVIIREENDVLLVPNQAIFGTFEQPLVRVMGSGGIEARAVELGNSDDIWTVVTEGLQEGDQVVIEATEASTDPFAAFRQARQAGGFGRGGAGFGGGGGFGGR